MGLQNTLDQWNSRLSTLPRSILWILANLGILNLPTKQEPVSVSAVLFH
jgi:hypothetical protein